jgi:hypothetical protein
MLLCHPTALYPCSLPCARLPLGVDELNGCMHLLAVDSQGVWACPDSQLLCCHLPLTDPHSVPRCPHARLLAAHHRTAHSLGLMPGEGGTRVLLPASSCCCLCCMCLNSGQLLRACHPAAALSLDHAAEGGIVHSGCDKNV